MKDVLNSPLLAFALFLIALGLSAQFGPSLRKSLRSLEEGERKNGLWRIRNRLVC
jgi:hypothetical protein